MDYQWHSTERSVVVRLADGAMIPADPANVDFQAASIEGIQDAPAHVASPQDFAVAMQAHIDAVAQARGYSDGVAFASYVSSNVPAWAAESQAFVLWRDAVWMYSYQQLAAVKSGARTAPTIDAFIAELPLVPSPS